MFTYGLKYFLYYCTTFFVFVQCAVLNKPECGEPFNCSDSCTIVWIGNCPIQCNCPQSTTPCLDTFCDPETTGATDVNPLLSPEKLLNDDVPSTVVTTKQEITTDDFERENLTRSTNVEEFSDTNLSELKNVTYENSSKIIGVKNEPEFTTDIETSTPLVTHSTTSEENELTNSYDESSATVTDSDDTASTDNGRENTDDLSTGQDLKIKTTKPPSLLKEVKFFDLPKRDDCTEELKKEIRDSRGYGKLYEEIRSRETTVTLLFPVVFQFTKRQLAERCKIYKSATSSVSFYAQTYCMSNYELYDVVYGTYAYVCGYATETYFFRYYECLADLRNDTRALECDTPVLPLRGNSSDSVCAAYNRLSACISDHVIRNCGYDALEIEFQYMSTVAKKFSSQCRLRRIDFNDNNNSTSD